MTTAWADGSGPRLSIVGTGLMATGLAQLAAARGLRVMLHGRSEESLVRAKQTLAAAARRLEKDPQSPQDGQAAQVDLTTDLELARHADVVVEAVIESLPAKRKIFAELGVVCPAETMLASVTSSIPISALAEGIAAPQRVIGMHFFSPVPRTSLCEIVCGEATSQETVDRALVLATALGKKTVVVERDVAGFVTTRLIVALMLEAARLVDSGVSTAEQVDTACRLAFGHPVGPLALADFIGIDVVHDSAEIIYESTQEPGFRLPPIVRDLVSSGRLGRKSGSGFHTYGAPVGTRRPPLPSDGRIR